MLVYKTSQEEKLFHLLEDILSKTGLIIVRLRITSSSLQIMIENTDHSVPVTIATCEDANRMIFSILESDMPEALNGKELEVSSAGVDRPITRFEDLHRFIGQNIYISSSRIIDEKIKLKKMKCTLLEICENRNFIIKSSEKGEQFTISFDDLNDAHAIFSFSKGKKKVLN